MCGIIGRISVHDNPSKTLYGLKELEYRGYDSYGIVLYNHSTKETLLQKDTHELPLDVIENLSKVKSNIEIGHTRWATHGRVITENAHPHCDNRCEFFVVMNGIIENFYDVKSKLIQEGFTFKSETDTEIIPILYAKYHKGNLVQTTHTVLKELKGEFSFAVYHKDQLLVYKNINPIIIGESDNELFISSDMNNVLENSLTHYVLEDNELVHATLNNTSLDYTFYTYTQKECSFIHKQPHKSVSKKIQNAKKTTYYMEKEILEQKNINNILTPTNIQNIQHIATISKSKQIFLTGAGTSYHAALFMHYKLLKNNIISQVILGSELSNYVKNINNSLVIAFSQSGETADLIHPLKDLKQNNELISIINTEHSTLERLSHKSIQLHCGKEVAVASTKAFTSQLFISILIDKLMNNKDYTYQLKQYETDFDNYIHNTQELVDRICVEYERSKNFFFLGRNQYYPLALEGALKLKEISYIHSEGFAGGELKHGPLALIEQESCAIILDSNQEILSNAMEIKSRGAKIIGIAKENSPIFDTYVAVPDYFKELFSSILMQTFALKMALRLGFNPDKPRNLAKSVTVK